MDLYCPRPTVEYLEDYRPGGLHPVDIDQIIHDRYRVINKLGFGYRSTVWLVEDLLSQTGHCFSLKILSAEASSETSELLVARLLQSQQKRHPAHPGRHHVVQIIDTFTIEGINGTHDCILTEVLGCANPVIVRLWACRVQAAKSVAAQVALAVDYLHCCGVIHGDLQFNNVRFSTAKLRSLSVDKVKDIYNPPIRIPEDEEDPSNCRRPQHLVRFDGGPFLYSSWFYIGTQVKVCDFSEAYIIRSQNAIIKEYNFMPTFYSAPEVLFEDLSHPTTSMEVWALGVFICAILTSGLPPFYGFSGTANEVIEAIVHTLGKPPEYWWVRWAGRARFFSEKGVPVLKGRQGMGRNGARGIELGVVTETEHDALRRILCNIFRYEPEERCSAREVVLQLPQDWVPSAYWAELDAYPMPLQVKA